MTDGGATLLLGLRLIMALALYAFLAWGLLVLWRDLKNQAQSIARQKVKELSVTLISEDGAQALKFTSPEIVIGRHPSCEWVLSNETVSSRHARMVYHHEQWWLEDLGSRNGTFLNGTALDGPAVLADQDQVRCGQVDFSVTFDEQNEKT